MNINQNINMTFQKLFITFLVSSIFLIFTKNVLAQQPKPSYLKAIVREISIGKAESTIKIELVEGSMKGKTFSIQQITTSQLQQQNFSKGDEVIISYDNSSKKEVIYIVDRVRTFPLLLLFGVFLILVVLIGRWQGLFSFLGMVLSFFIIGQFVIPNIILGSDPVVITLLSALFIIPLTFYIAHGVNWKTTLSIISTVLALILTGILAYIFVDFTKLTGFAAEESTYLQAMTSGALNIKNLLLAGIIIGAMGILDDITIAQTGIVEKMYEANPKYTNIELFFHGMDVGRDHIASLVNTLILVYAGAALPLFLLFYNSQLSYFQVVNQEIVATEIVRTLVSSIGIVSAVPISTWLASIFVKKYARKK